MNNEHPEPRSKLQQTLAEFESESRQVIGEQRENLASLKETMRLSLRVVAIASLPSVVWVSCWSVIAAANESIWTQVLSMCFALVILAVVSIAVSRASGLFAYFWFNRTVIRLRLATIVLALLAAAMVFGWVIIVIEW